MLRSRTSKVRGKEYICSVAGWDRLRERGGWVKGKEYKCTVERGPRINARNKESLNERKNEETRNEKPSQT